MYQDSNITHMRRESTQIRVLAGGGTRQAPDRGLQSFTFGGPSGGGYCVQKRQLPVYSLSKTGSLARDVSPVTNVSGWSVRLP